jgi:hypothetical protein
MISERTADTHIRTSWAGCGWLEAQLAACTSGALLGY